MLTPIITFFNGELFSLLRNEDLGTSNKTNFGVGGEGGEESKPTLGARGRGS